MQTTTSINSNSKATLPRWKKLPQRYAHMLTYVTYVFQQYVILHRSWAGGVSNAAAASFTVHCRLCHFLSFFLILNVFFMLHSFLLFSLPSPTPTPKQLLLPLLFLLLLLLLPLLLPPWAVLIWASSCLMQPTVTMRSRWPLYSTPLGSILTSRTL